jgi:uncharacterized membrane protein YhaH (DUF805 family)
MNRTTQKSLHLGRAIWTFVLAYVVITIVATAFSIVLEKAMQVPDSAQPLENRAYLLAERFFPLLNFMVWMPVAALYFKGCDRIEDTREAKLLGAFWLALAVVVDYVGFVLIKNPISLSPHDFYIGQFPWIYLIYLVVLVSPWCYVVLRRKFSSASAASS